MEKAKKKAKVNPRGVEASASSSSTGGMTGLQELWDRQSKRKTKLDAKLPRYMQTTEAARSRQTSIKKDLKRGTQQKTTKRISKTVTTDNKPKHKPLSPRNRGNAKPTTQAQTVKPTTQSQTVKPPAQTQTVKPPAQSRTRRAPVQRKSAATPATSSIGDACAQDKVERESVEMKKRAFSPNDKENTPQESRSKRRKVVPQPESPPPLDLDEGMKEMVNSEVKPFLSAESKTTLPQSTHSELPVVESFAPKAAKFSFKKKITNTPFRKAPRTPGLSAINEIPNDGVHPQSPEREIKTEVKWNMETESTSQSSEVCPPEITTPALSSPEVSQPEVSEPEAMQPEVTQPEVTQPEAMQSEVTPPAEKNVQYFKDLVHHNTEKLESLAAHWDAINQDIEVSEEVHGELRSTACQARLIIKERFNQFSGLITKCETKTGDKPVLVGDLDGFWDMIYYQVEDVLAKFDKLAELQKADWQMKTSPAGPKKVKVVKKKVVKPKAVSKFAAFRANLKQSKAAANSDSVPTEKDVIATPSVEERKEVTEKTYSLRKATVEKTFDTHLKRLSSTPAMSVSKRRSVTSRTQSRRKSTKVKATVPIADASPSLAAYLPASSKPISRLSIVSMQGRRSCSPSPLMVKAMMSASKSGRTSQVNSPLERRDSLCPAGGPNLDGSISQYLPSTTPHTKRRPSRASSLHRQVLTSAAASPATMINQLSLTQSSEPTVVDDLVLLTPEKNGDKPLVTPRRSARLARNQRISLL